MQLSPYCILHVSVLQYAVERFNNESRVSLDINPCVLQTANRGVDPELGFRQECRYPYLRSIILTLNYISSLSRLGNFGNFRADSEWMKVSKAWEP